MLVPHDRKFSPLADVLVVAAVVLIFCAIAAVVTIAMVAP